METLWWEFLTKHSVTFAPVQSQQNNIVPVTWTFFAPVQPQQNEIVPVPRTIVAPVQPQQNEIVPVYESLQVPAQPEQNQLVSDPEALTAISLVVPKKRNIFSQQVLDVGKKRTRKSSQIYKV